MSNQPDSTHVSTDELLGAVNHAVRRSVLRQLSLKTTPIPVERLAVALVTEASSGGLPSSAERERMEIALVHVHLPKLESAGLVRHDSEDGVVTPGHRLQTGRNLLRVIEEVTNRPVWRSPGNVEDHA